MAKVFSPAQNLLDAKRLLVSIISTLTLSFSVNSLASPITDMYVFGDSLSDTGALNVLAPGACPPSPYFDCRFSNGPVWVEHLAADLGVSANTAYAGGTNYAIGGQRSDQVAFGQVPLFNANVGGVADPNALYVIWAGGNDFLQNASTGIFDPITAANNVLFSVLNLAAMGAEDFLVSNLPILDPWALTFNAALAAGLSSIGGGLNITQFDAFSLFVDITFNASTYGFTNVSDPCFTGVSLCSNPDEYLFWDTVHPTAAAHKVVASAALQALNIRVPEPPIAILLLTGVAALVVTRRRRSQGG